MKIEDLIKTEQLNEAIYAISAGKTRSRLINYAKRLMDSDNVQALSNFESYEEEDHISLKIGIYGSVNSRLSIDETA